MQLLDQQERTGYWVIETDSANVYSWLATSAVKQWRLQSLFNSIAVLGKKLKTVQFTHAPTEENVVKV